MTEARSSFSLRELEAAAALVHATVSPTPQYRWPKLSARTGCEVWVKHESHTPTGAFKIRGGLVYMHALATASGARSGVVTATRGNHGQSIAFAARRAGIAATIYVPHGNSEDQNSAMRGLGATVVEHGKDFDEARVEAMRAARDQELHFVPPFHPELVKGVATYALELFRAVSELDTVYVPIGMGSGICGLIATRDLLGLETEIVGVVAGNAPAMALSFAAGRPISTESARTFADGIATREPHPDALDSIRRGAARIVQVDEDAIAEAIRVYFDTTHNVAEGAAASPLAALLAEADSVAGKRVGLILTGCNIERDRFRRVLAGETPSVR